MKYKYWLANINGIGNATKRRLLDIFYDARGIYEATKQEYLMSGSLRNEPIAEYVMMQKKDWELEAEYEGFLKRSISFVSMDMLDYPRALLNIHNAPYALYYIGTLPSPDERIVSMVGARRCSCYGRIMAEQIAGELAKADISVVSGMALGIDSAAHNGALKSSGKTYAFLGCGVDVIYPPKNVKLYNRIIRNGAVISDFAPGTQPLSKHFPSRNRLISGLAEKVIVVEAKKRSGSIITADLALEQGRDVYAVPGRITDAMSEGTNRLISEGAGILCDASQIIFDMKELPESGIVARSRDQRSVLPDLNEDEKKVYDALDFYAKSIEQLQNECRIELLDLLSVLLRLSGMGLAKECFKNQYVKVA